MKERDAADTSVPVRSQTIRVRLFRPADLDTVIELFKGSVRKVARRDYTANQVAAWAPNEIDREQWAARTVGNSTWVAEIDAVIAGFIDLKPDGHIDMLYVDPALQGQGVATALLSQVEAAARVRRIPKLFAEASITARPFFEKQGFRVTSPQTVKLRGEEFLNFKVEKPLA